MENIESMIRNYLTCKVQIRAINNTKRIAAQEWLRKNVVVIDDTRQREWSPELDKYLAQNEKKKESYMVYTFGKLEKEFHRELLTYRFNFSEEVECLEKKLRDELFEVLFKNTDTVLIKELELEEIALMKKIEKILTNKIK